MLEGHEIELTISPFKGRKKKVTLNRTRYQICFKNIDAITIQDQMIQIPSLANVSDMFLQLEEGRYSFQSESSFQINGVSTSSGKIIGATKILVGYSILVFRKVSREFLEGDGFDYHSIAQSDLNVLITGETGTGKGYTARRIYHEKSAGEFVQVNISSFSKSLIESELFGHKQGAFTGAHKDREGVIARANRGTLFIDEVDSLDLDLQVKLLNFLDDGAYYPVGSSSIEKSQCRVIFSSGQNLEKLVEQGKFRKDLFFRITAGACVNLKPLRSRKNIIRRQIEMFEKEYSVSFAKGLIDFYFQFSWPGNIRQLRGHLEKKIKLSVGSFIVFDDVDKALMTNGNLLSEVTFEEYKVFKRKYIELIFYSVGSSAKRASEVLKIHTKTIEKILENESTRKDRVNVNALNLTIDF